VHETLGRAASLRSNEYTLDPSPRRLGELVPVPPAERGDRDALWRRLRRDGYLFLKGILDRDKILEFRRSYFSALAPAGLLQPGSQPIEGIAGAGPVDGERARAILFNQIVPGPEYDVLCTSPELVGFYEWFLGGQVFLHKRKIIRHVRVGEGGATGAHFDLVYLRGGTDRLYTSWIPIGDTPATNGGLIYLEGSHEYFYKLDQEATKKVIAQWLTKDLPDIANRLDTRWLVADYEAGDMVVHTPYMVHAALNNSSPTDAMRLSTDIRYQLVSDPIDQRWQNHWRDDDGL